MIFQYIVAKPLCLRDRSYKSGISFQLSYQQIGLLNSSFRMLFLSHSHSFQTTIIFYHGSHVPTHNINCSYLLPFACLHSPFLVYLSLTSSLTLTFFFDLCTALLGFIFFFLLLFFTLLRLAHAFYHTLSHTCALKGHSLSRTTLEHCK